MADVSTGEVVSGDYVETMRHLRGDPLFLFADGAPGRQALRFYDVTIEAQGYEIWRREGVPVTSDECGIRQTQFDVWMVPTGG